MTDWIVSPVLTVRVGVLLSVTVAGVVRWVSPNVMPVALPLAKTVEAVMLTLLASVRAVVSSVRVPPLRTRVPMPTGPLTRVPLVTRVPAVTFKVPEVKVVPPEKVFWPERTSEELALFSKTPVTLLPMLLMIVVVPEPMPELVMVPALLTDPVENVIVPLPELWLASVRLNAPVTPPLKVSDPASELMVEFAASTTGMVALLVPLTFSNAPVAPVAPFPEIVRVVTPVDAMPPDTCAVAPDATVIALFFQNAVRLV